MELSTCNSSTTLISPSESSSFSKPGDDVLPPGFENDDDSDGEINVVDELHVDNSISNSANELSDNVASDFDNPSVLRPPPEPPDAEFDFELDAGDEISVVMNAIRDKFDSVRIPSLTLVSPFRTSGPTNSGIESSLQLGFTPHRLKFLVFGYLSRSARSLHLFFEISLRKSISLISIA
nr:hypothetical protein [Tanacetum cinerariifolium]